MLLRVKLLLRLQARLLFKSFMGGKPTQFYEISYRLNGGS